MKATREELIELIEQLPEEQVAEIAVQIKHLVELKSPRNLNFYTCMETTNRIKYK